MLAMVGSPMAAFLSNKYITIYIWPCMTGAHSWPRVLLTSQPTLQTHWARVAVVSFTWENIRCSERQVPGITLQFWSLSDTNLSFRCKEGSYQVPWQPVICWLAHTPCFISSVPGSPKWCHFCASLWAVFFPSPDPHPRAPVEVWGVWRSYTALPESRELMPLCVSPPAPWKTILINEAFS